MAHKLTDRQRAIYDFIRDLIVRRGYGPTVREIAKRFGIRSPNGVMCHLRALERKGLIRRDANKARAIELTVPAADRNRSSAEGRGGLPFGGFVSSGFADRAFELNECVDFGEMFRGKDCFVVRVVGDSMIEAHIADGDYVICRAADTAERGQMVVVLNERGEATLKYWYPEANGICLQPANSAMEPIYVRRAQVRGVVIGVVRGEV